MRTCYYKGVYNIFIFDLLPLKIRLTSFHRVQISHRQGFYFEGGDQKSRCSPPVFTSPGESEGRETVGGGRGWAEGDGRREGSLDRVTSDFERTQRKVTATPQNRPERRNRCVAARPARRPVGRGPSSSCSSKGDNRRHRPQYGASDRSCIPRSADRVPLPRLLCCCGDAN